MMQLSNEGAGAPGSPSSPGSDPGGAGRSAAGAAREKPVKVLPCPRCESMNTKFCYYNNYSVTQPRHFCRQCQRYWTAGGTLRNVPVGGGSRKKNRPHGHARPGEPYSQRSPGAPSHSSSSSPSFTAGAFGGQPGPFGFQQHNDIVLPGFSLPPGQYVAHQPFGLDQLSQLSPGVYSSVLNKPPQHDADSNLQAMFANNPTSGAPSSIHPGAPYFPGSFQPDVHSVKPEFWPARNNNYQASRLESPSSSMLLNLGLNHADRPVPVQWDQSDLKPTTVRNGSSPLHDSSIEEEGSTPSNGFSNSGYEEGDAVSSMWHSLHDMDNLHLSVKW